MLENVISVAPEALLDEAAKIKFQGYKLVTVSCVELDASTIDILYHFDQEFQLKHFRVSAPREMVIPSISHIFPASFLVENEIQDLFNITFSNLSIDFKRTLFLENGIKSGPLCRYTLDSPQPPETAAAESTD